MTEEPTPLKIFLWMFISDIVQQEGGYAIDVKIIFDHVSAKIVPQDTNQAFNQVTEIRHMAKTLANKRAEEV